MSQEHDLEAQLTAIAASFPFPATPDFAATDRSLARRTSPRLAWAAVALLVVLLGAMVVPPVRAALVEVVRVGAVQVRLGEPTPVAPQLQLDLPGETTLQAAQAASPVHVPLPAALGAPDRVFVLANLGNAVVLVWESEAIALYVIPSGQVVHKLAPENAQLATVNGVPALWASGDHFLELVQGEPEIRIYVADHVLIWEARGVTYRLETARSMRETVEIAESLK